MLTLQVRDLVSWIHDMGALISTDETVRSVSGAEGLLAKHSEYKAEIDAREDSVAQVCASNFSFLKITVASSSVYTVRLEIFAIFVVGVHLIYTI